VTDVVECGVPNLRPFKFFERKLGAMSMSHSLDFEPTRAAGLASLAAFVPSAGRHYEGKRNNDLGPDRRDNVSMLSPYIRHRLVTEEEVLSAVLGQHTATAAEKFIQEVFWRTYFKGHLETRPAIWRNYRKNLDDQIASLANGSGIRTAYEQAVEGRTSIACFNAWIQELIETGYLHNHARMWFASIWIFTLRLPWELGADFMFRHLLDGDPASNTLSWRWVGGLHTKGKTYLARADNIRLCTEGRFSPEGLAQDAPALEEPSLPAAQPLSEAAGRFPSGRIGLLLTGEDLHPMSLAQSNTEIVAIAGADLVEALSQLEVAARVKAFNDGALADGLASASTAFGAPSASLPSLSMLAIEDWARMHAIETIATAYAPVGPVADRLAEIAPGLQKKGIRLVQIRRAYDTLAWPHGTRGFFAMKEKVPGIIQRLGIGPRDAEAQLALFTSG
jgi:deoxyribodipyrimidine photo-lyase